MGVVMKRVLFLLISFTFVYTSLPLFSAYTSDDAKEWVHVMHPGYNNQFDVLLPWHPINQILWYPALNQEAVFNDSLIPLLNVSIDVGRSSHWWNRIYARNLEVTNLFAENISTINLFTDTLSTDIMVADYLNITQVNATDIVSTFFDSSVFNVTNETYVTNIFISNDTVINESTWSLKIPISVCGENQYLQNVTRDGPVCVDLDEFSMDFIAEAYFIPYWDEEFNLVASQLRQETFIYSDGSFIPFYNITFNLGSPEELWQNVYVSEIHVNEIRYPDFEMNESFFDSLNLFGFCPSGMVLQELTVEGEWRCISLPAESYYDSSRPPVFVEYPEYMMRIQNGTPFSFRIKAMDFKGDTVTYEMDESDFDFDVSSDSGEVVLQAPSEIDSIVTGSFEAKSDSGSDFIDVVLLTYDFQYDLVSIYSCLGDIPDNVQSGSSSSFVEMSWEYVDSSDLDPCQFTCLPSFIYDDQSNSCVCPPGEEEVGGVCVDLGEPICGESARNHTFIDNLIHLDSLCNAGNARNNIGDEFRGPIYLSPYRDDVMSWRCYEGSVFVSCSAQYCDEGFKADVDGNCVPIIGPSVECGSDHGKTLITLTDSSPDLCSIGSATSFVLKDDGSGWTWNCGDASCSADKQSYEILFDSQGGSEVDPIVVYHEDVIDPLPHTSRSGYDFEGWFTEAIGGTELLTITPITSAGTYYAQWSDVSPQMYTLEVSPVPVDGAIVHAMGTIACSEADSSMCLDSYTDGTVVTLTAIPDTGYAVGTWQGDASDCGSAAECTIIMDSNKTVSVSFTRELVPLSNTLTIALEGTGQGNVTITEDEGIIGRLIRLFTRVEATAFTCVDQVCTYDFSSSPEVRISAQPASGSSFEGFSIDCSGDSQPCIVTMDADKRVDVTFNALSPTIGIPELYTGNYYDNYFNGDIGVRSSVSHPGGNNLLSSCSVKFNSGEWQSATLSGGYCSSSYSGLADVSVQFRVTDAGGNSYESSAESFIYDDTAPVTTASATANGNSYSSGSLTNADEVIISLSCDDGVGVGCDTTTYCTFEDCTPSNTYSSEFQITAEGRSVIRYRSSDLLGNVEDTKEFVVIRCNDDRIWNSNLVQCEDRPPDVFALSLSKTGTGTGKIQGASFSCGTECAPQLARDESYTMSAIPDSDSVFTGWTVTSGVHEQDSCLGTGSCSFFMAGYKAITAQFDLKQYTVTFNPNGGSGGGSVQVAHGSTIPSSDVPSVSAPVGHQFVGWFTQQTGGTEFLSTTQITSDTTYYARWEPIMYTLTVEGVPEGYIVALDSVNCRDGDDEAVLCSVDLPHGSDVDLLSQPISGYGHDFWTGDCAEFTHLDNCELQMLGDKTISAQFVPLCGNNIIDEGEVCDGDDVPSFFTESYEEGDWFYSHRDERTYHYENNAFFDNNIERWTLGYHGICSDDCKYVSYYRFVTCPENPQVGADQGWQYFKPNVPDWIYHEGSTPCPVCGSAATVYDPDVANFGSSPQFCTIGSVVSSPSTPDFPSDSGSSSSWVCGNGFTNVTCTASKCEDGYHVVDGVCVPVPPECNPPSDGYSIDIPSGDLCMVGSLVSNPYEKETSKQWGWECLNVDDTIECSTDRCVLVETYCSAECPDGKVLCPDGKCRLNCDEALYLPRTSIITTTVVADAYCIGNNCFDSWDFLPDGVTISTNVPSNHLIFTGSVRANALCVDNKCIRSITGSSVSGSQTRISGDLSVTRLCIDGKGCITSWVPPQDSLWSNFLAWFARVFFGSTGVDPPEGLKEFERFVCGDDGYEVVQSTGNCNI